jgi:phosphatidylinositol dimannoside acyltransferase
LIKRDGPFSEGIGPALGYFGFRAGAWLAERAPIRAGNAIAVAGGRLAYVVARRKRAVVRKNLARVVGEGTHLDTAVRGAFDSYARYWLETFRSSRYSREQLLEMVRCDEWDLVESTTGRGKGMVVVTPHFGFYDLAVAWFGAKGHPMTTVAEVLRPRALFEWFAETRRVRGMPVIPAKPGESARQRLLEVVRGGGGVALVSDRDLGRRGIWVEFFGEPTTIPAFPAILVEMTQAPLLIGGMLGLEDGRYRLIFEELPYDLTGEPNADNEALAQIIAHGLERMIRRAPEQWHIFSTNWPSDEAHLPPRGIRATA